MVLLTVSLCMLLYSNAVLTELSDQVAEAQEKHQMLLAENERLQTSIESRMSLRNIEDIAKKASWGLSEHGAVSRSPMSTAAAAIRS